MGVKGDRQSWTLNVRSKSYADNARYVRSFGNPPGTVLADKFPSVLFIRFWRLMDEMKKFTCGREVEVGVRDRPLLAPLALSPLDDGDLATVTFCCFLGRFKFLSFSASKPWGIIGGPPLAP